MGSVRVWLPSLVAAACMAVALALSAGAIAGVTRPVLITGIVGLAGVAIGASLFWSMGLVRESIALRLIAAVPVLLSILLVVVLILDADFRARAGRWVS
jgi:hypothetical protein